MVEANETPLTGECSMTVAETLAWKLRQLPLSRQMEVLSFVESLEHNEDAQAGPRRDPEGLLADEPSDLTLEGFAEARREAWGNFPREIPR
jgi:hypothetical protein